MLSGSLLGSKYLGDKAWGGPGRVLEISEGWVLAGLIASFEGPGQVLGGPVVVLRGPGQVLG